MWLIGVAGLLLVMHGRCEDVCNTAQLKCDNGVCVPQSWTCDGVDDCGDGTDEQNCATGDDNTDNIKSDDAPAGMIESCGESMFRCGPGLCIPSSWQCDGEKDCPVSGLDEWAALCGNYDTKIHDTSSSVLHKIRGVRMMSSSVMNPVYQLPGTVMVR